MCGAICGVSRGRFIEPILFSESGIKFIDDNYNEIKTDLSEKYPCEHEKHWQWGRGTRNGQKLKFHLAEMFYQKWHLTEEELKQAVDNYDMFSLEMRGRIICKDCAEKEQGRDE